MSRPHTPQAKATTFLEMSNIPPAILTEQSFRLDHIDFVPNCLQKGSAFEAPKFEKFDTLVSRANDWLKQQTSVNVKMVETVTINARNGEADPDDYQVYDRSVGVLRFVRILRVWLTPAEANTTPFTEQLGYITIQPKFMGRDRSDKPVYESVEDTVSRLNKEFLQNPIPGRIVTVETLEIQHTKQEEIELDSCAVDDLGSRFLTVLRMFYVHGPPIMEQIGMADFVPRHMGQGHRAVAYYEDFGQLCETARRWLVEQKGIRVCNVQSVKFRLPELNDGITYHSHRTFFYAHGQIRFARVLRVVFVTSQFALTPDPAPYLLNYKTFIPVWLERGSGPGNWKFENLAQTMNRVDMWLKCTGAKVVSVDTLPVRMMPPFYHQSERTMTYHLKSGHYNLFAIRLYITGDYKEPPPSMLPPVPAEPKKESCTIL